MYNSDCCTKEPTVCFANVMVGYLYIKVIMVITIYVTQAVYRHALSTLRVFFEDLGTRTLSRLLLMAFFIIQDDISMIGFK